MDPVICYEGVGYKWEDFWVLRDVNLTLEKGRFYYLLGCTGAGKTTLLRLLYRDLTPQEGKIYVEKTEVHTLARKDLAYLRRQIGVVFQDFQLLPTKTLYENVAFALEVRQTFTRRQIQQQVTDILMRVGLIHRKDAYPHQLSGGEQQRACIARALVGKPVALIADEPTGNLDPQTGREIMQLLYQIPHWGTTVWIATHNLSYLQEFPAPAYLCQNQTVYPYEG